MLRRPLLWLIAIFVCGSIQADSPVFAPDKIALAGYDVVAYYTDQQASMGLSEFSYQWGGVEWRFTHQQHRDLFVNSPEAYQPLFGGFCALGVAHGALVPSDPRAWSMHDGRLILNQDEQVATTWRYNPDINVARAQDSYASAKIRYSEWQQRLVEQGTKKAENK